MPGNKVYLCLILSVVSSNASQTHISEQQTIQAQHQPSRENIKTRTPFQSLLEVGYFMPSKPQGTGKCKGIAKMCKSSPQPEMNYPTELDSKFVDNACFDFQSVLPMCWFVCVSGSRTSLFIMHANSHVDAKCVRIWRGTVTSLSQRLLPSITSCQR